jgi:hypothetical protein
MERKIERINEFMKDRFGKEEIKRRNKGRRGIWL